MFGYGNYDLAIGTLEKAVAGKEYIAADHFTAADLFVGANVNFMLHSTCSSRGRPSSIMRGA